MPTMTEKLTKVTFYVPERIRRALAIVSAERNAPVGELITAIVEEQFPDQLSQADRAIAEGTDAGKSKRGRKPKGGE